MTYRRDAMARALSPHRVAAAEAERDALRQFCARYGLEPDAQAVTVYLTASSDPDDPDGKATRRRLARLDLAAHMHGEAPPGSDVGVRKFLRGFHWDAPLGPRPERGEPLYAGDIRVLVDQVMSPTWRQVRDWAFLTVVNQSGLRGSEVLRVQWSDVTLRRDRCLIRVNLLHGRRPPIAHVAELTRDRRSLACPIRAMWRLRGMTASDQQPVFGYKADHAANKRLRGLLRDVGAVSGSKHPPGHPWTASSHVVQAATRVLAPRALAYRDRALLTMGFLAALTPGEAAALTVGDVEETHEGLVIRLPQRRYPNVALPFGADSRYCPVQAWRDWARTLATATAVTPNIPAFPYCDYYQPVVRNQRLTPGGLSKIIITTAADAGLVGRYPFSSLRAGFVRSALRSGASHYDIARQVGYHYLAAVEAQERRERLLSGNIAEVIGL